MSLLTTQQLVAIAEQIVTTNPYYTEYEMSRVGAWVTLSNPTDTTDECQLLTIWNDHNISLAANQKRYNSVRIAAAERHALTIIWENQ